MIVTQLSWRMCTESISMKMFPLAVVLLLSEPPTAMKGTMLCSATPFSKETSQSLNSTVSHAICSHDMIVHLCFPLVISGFITTLTLLDFEQTTSYNLVVAATDNGSPSLTGTYPIVSYIV